MSDRFLDRVGAEVARQSELRRAGQPIPWGATKYARLLGLAIFLAGAAAAGVVAGIGALTGGWYPFLVLFFAAISLAGLAQAVAGRHWLTRRRCVAASTPCRIGIFVLGKRPDG